MKDYEAVLLAKNSEIAEARQLLGMLQKESKQIKRDLERVSALLAESD